MSKYTFISTSSQDPTLPANWLKDDGTNAAPGAGDDVFIQGIPGSALANIWAAGNNGLAATSTPTTSGAASTGGSLAQSTSYYYVVSAINASGEGPVSAELTYAVPASGTATNQITINWTAVTNATGYKIYRGTASGTNLYLATVGAVILYADTTATVPAGGPPGSVTFASLTISQTYTGTIGNAGIGGYWKQPVTAWIVGNPSGTGQTASGSGRIKIDFGSVQYTGTVLNSGQSTDANQMPIRIKGTNSSNKLSVINGNVGVATNQPGETSTISQLDVVGSQTAAVTGSGVTLTTVNAANGCKLTTNSAITTLTTSGASQTNCNGAVKLTTINNGASLALNNRPASGNLSDTINNYSSGAIDFSGGPGNGTVAQFNLYAGSTFTVDPSNPSHITITARTLINGGVTSIS